MVHEFPRADSLDGSKLVNCIHGGTVGYRRMPLGKGKKQMLLFSITSQNNLSYINITLQNMGTVKKKHVNGVNLAKAAADTVVPTAHLTCLEMV